MIGIIDVKIQAHNPNFPLEPVFTFINSDSSFRVRNVPKQIGQWKITKVFVNLSYPDNTVVSKECVLNGGIWVGTVTGCSISGSVEQGFTVTAQGINEDGETLSNYVLGAGDIYVKDIDGSISPGSSAARMFYYEEVPADAKEGDTAFINGILNIYNGTQWVLCYNAVPTYIEDSRGNKIEADLDVTIRTNEFAPWYLNSFRSTEYDPPVQLDYKEVLLNNLTSKVWITDEYVEGIDGGNYFVAISSNCQLVYMLKEVEEDVYSIRTMYHTDIVYASVLQINFLESGTIPVDFTRNSVYIMDTSKLVTQNELNDEIERITDEIPTKTSDLTNDSGFITSTQVEPSNIVGYAENSRGTTYLCNINNGSTYDTLNILQLPDGVPTVTSKSYFPWQLSKWYDDTFSTPLQLEFKYIGTIQVPLIPGMSLPTNKTINQYGWIGSSDTLTHYIIKAEMSNDVYQPTAMGKFNSTTSDFLPITASALSIDTVDGQSGVVTCTRTNSYINTFKTLVFNDELPTKTSDLTNDSGFITSSTLSNYYTKTEIDNIIGNINTVLDNINGEVI